MDSFPSSSAKVGPRSLKSSGLSTNVFREYLKRHIIQHIDKIVLLPILISSFLGFSELRNAMKLLSYFSSYFCQL